MILISKRRKIAKIGAHLIYKIVDTTMFYLPNTNKNNQDELRYLKMFQNVDLSSNFYFSYSYDITHTLQYNLTPCNYYDQDLIDKNILEKFNLNNKSSCICNNDNSNNDNQQKLHDSMDDDLNDLDDKKNEFCFNCNINKEYAIKNKPNFKFCWNEYLLESANIHTDWLVYIIHGYVGQTVIKEFGKELYLTLIARRSARYAGTRFLKRGCNQDGDVANEVESEQIVSEIEKINFNTAKFLSFVHIRGSIPSHWSQDIPNGLMVPKPQILIDIVDPFSVAAGKHFNQLMARYGSPIFVLNLVKMKEKKPHETLLTNEITRTISYLNQFIPPAFHIQYIGMDMARINKSKDKNVLQNLSLLAYSTIKKIGLFSSFKTESYSNFNLAKCDDLGGWKRDDGIVLQTGVVRVNCVDCLDRTNTAAYVLGKTALAFQLFGMGLISDPLNAESNLIFEKKVCKKLEQLYDEHGDVLALQYGGSQLVHRIKTYRKKSHLSSQSRDFMQTISRYCSNTFSDFDKQMAINLFLGSFRAYYTLNCNQNYLINSKICVNPNSNQNSSTSSLLAYSHIWQMTTDFYLHNLNTLKRHVFNSSRLYTKWYDEKTLFCLPRSCNEIFKGINGNIQCLIRKKRRCVNDKSNDKFSNNKTPNQIKTRPDFDFQFSNLSTTSDITNNRPTPTKKNSFIKFNSNCKLVDESTDEYNEHYNCYEYTSFDTLHYFELSRLLRSSEKTQHSSTGDHPLSFLFSSMKNTLLGTPKMNKIDESKFVSSNQTVSSESSEDEDSIDQDFDKIQTLNDYSFSLSLDRSRFNSNFYLDSKYVNLDIKSATKPLMRHSTSDNTNLKSLSNKKISLSSINDLNQKFSKDELNRRSLNRIKNIYGPIYVNPSKLDLKLYQDYVLLGTMGGEFNINKQQEKLDQSEFILNYEEDQSRNVIKKKNSKQYFTVSESDLTYNNQRVNFKSSSINTSTNQLKSLLNYDNFETNEELDQLNFSDTNKEDKKLLSNYLDDNFSQIKISSKCKEDYKQYLRLIS